MKLRKVRKFLVKDSEGFSNYHIREKMPSDALKLLSDTILDECKTAVWKQGNPQERELKHCSRR